MNIILFDDDENLRQQCRTLINKYGYNLQLSTGLPSEIQKYLRKHYEPALYFIDIVIGTDNRIGFNLAEDIKNENKNNMVVFITGYPDMILYNTKAKALASLVILKSREYFKSELLETLEIAETLFSGKAFFRYHTKYMGYGIIALEDILYLEKVKGRNTINIHHCKGNLIIHSTFLEVMKQLDCRFLRCHNSFIVNIDKISRVDLKSRKLFLGNDRFCFYSRGHKKELDKCLQSTL